VSALTAFISMFSATYLKGEIGKFHLNNEVHKPQIKTLKFKKKTKKD